MSPAAHKHVCHMAVFDPNPPEAGGRSCSELVAHVAMTPDSVCVLQPVDECELIKTSSASEGRAPCVAPASPAGSVGSVFIKVYWS